MNGIIEFGYARLDEEEAAAKTAASGVGPDWVFDTADDWLCSAKGIFLADLSDPKDPVTPVQVGPFLARNDPSAVLRDIEGKRAIVRSLEIASREVGGSDHALVRDVWEQAVRNLLMRWDDHPDYEEAWKP